MPRRSLPRPKLFNIAPRRPPRLSRPSSTLTAVPAFPDIPSDPVWNAKLNQFKRSLIYSTHPSQVWSNYTSLLNLSAFDLLPAEIHQHVLRRCTPPATEMRATAAHRLLTVKAGSPPHSYEGRFQIIIRNIRATGVEPALDDYHFILTHFAAVGHPVGSMQVFHELVYRGHSPEEKTYGLCLQAIAHRFTLPIFRDNRLRLVETTRRMFTQLMTDMRKRSIPFSAANLDLSMRVLKETLDQEGFDSLMKWGYGIDLANPDRAPLEYIEAMKAIPELQGGEILSPLPFSTNALNTTIDFLGRSGNISKLVLAFEVLTQPLPKANEHFFSSFDDDDDFGVAGGASSSSSFSPPHTVPNLTTYNLLLRHICHIGHPTLARHYFLQAIKLERETDNLIRKKLFGWTPLSEIVSPQFSMNRSTLVPVLGLSNRDKNLGLMRWLLSKMPFIVRTKKRDLFYYMKVRQERLKWERENKDCIVPTTAVDPLLKPPNDPASTPINASPSTIAPVPIKPFDIKLHISILQRNLYDSERFHAHLEHLVGRTTQRLKERLGRRVWAGKDIYMADVNKRIMLSRDAWARSAGFRERREPPKPTVIEFPPPDVDTSLRHVPPHLTLGRKLEDRTPFFQPSSRRSFSTMSSRDSSLWQTLWRRNRP